MRRQLALCITGSCLLLSGCSLVANAARNVCFEVSETLDECQELRQLKKLAEAAWTAYQAEHPDPAATDDFGAGFRDGYVDFLKEGGNGQPPPVPPRRYWKSRYETPEGYRAIEAWYAGFRQGAAAAAASGQRQWVTVPSGLTGPASLAPEGPPPGMPPVATPEATPAPGHDPSAPAAPAAEPLPAPRNVPPEAEAGKPRTPATPPTDDAVSDPWPLVPGNESTPEHVRPLSRGQMPESSWSSSEKPALDLLVLAPLWECVPPTSGDASPCRTGPRGESLAVPDGPGITSPRPGHFR